MGQHIDIAEDIARDIARAVPNCDLGLLPGLTAQTIVSNAASSYNLTVDGVCCPVDQDKRKTNDSAEFVVLRFCGHDIGGDRHSAVARA